MRSTFSFHAKITQYPGIKFLIIIIQYGAAMEWWLSYSPCKSGLAGSILHPTGLLDETEVPSPYDISCWWQKEDHGGPISLT